jgi:Fe2+ transport system protein FeoA
MTTQQKQSAAISLVKLKKNTRARIVEIAGAKTLALKLSSMGLRTGATLVKISAFALKGPVTIKVGSTTLALGHTMAEKVLVEPHP